MNESHPSWPPPQIFRCLPDVSCVANGNKSEANIFLYFVLFCARFYLPLDLSLTQTPRAQTICVCTVSKQKLFSYSQIEKIHDFFSSSLKYVFYTCLWSDFVTCQSHCEYTQSSSKKWKSILQLSMCVGG